MVNVGTSLKSWKVYKSDIKRSLENGFDPAAYNNANDYRKASAPPPPRNVKPPDVLERELQELLDSTVLRSHTKLAMLRIVSAATLAKPNTETEVDKILGQAADQLGELLDITLITQQPDS